MEVVDFEISPYRQIWQLQKDLQSRVIYQKREKTLSLNEYILVGEHFPVYTLGFHGNSSNMLINEEQLNNNNCELIRIERGGDITYHGPGQLIMYPIIDLISHSLGVKSYISLLETTVIELLKEYGIKGEHIEGATGVWIDKGGVRERKICAIGVKISRGVTLHGLGLNVNTDLRAFSLINPCGFIDKGVTSMEKELQRRLNMNDIKKRAVEIFLKLLN